MDSSSRWVVVAGVAAAVAVAGPSTVRTLLARDRRRPELFTDAHGGTRHRLGGPILDRYLLEGGPSGHLGRPTSDPRTPAADPLTPVGADREARFEYGVIFLRGGSTKVIAWPGAEP